MQTVWQFDVDIADGNISHTLVVRTDARWTNVLERILDQLDEPRDRIRLVYRIRGDPRGPSNLLCASDWDLVLRRVREKILSARTRAVTVEVKDMVSTASRDIIFLFSYKVARAGDEGWKGQWRRQKRRPRRPRRTRRTRRPRRPRRRKVPR